MQMKFFHRFSQLIPLLIFLLAVARQLCYSSCIRGYGGIGRRAGFRFLWSDPCGFDPHYPYHVGAKSALLRCSFILLKKQQTGRLFFYFSRFCGEKSTIYPGTPRIFIEKRSSLTGLRCIMDPLNCIFVCLPAAAATRGPKGRRRIHYAEKEMDGPAAGSGVLSIPADRLRQQGHRR